jgi:hypothetical protein
VSKSNPVITLESWEYERGFAVGIGRFTANWGKADARHYDRSKMEADRNAQAAAALCEIAVAKYTNKYWHGHVWHRTDHWKHRAAADVGTDIEVRRVRTRPAVAVRRSDAGRQVWAARLADDEYTKVELLGVIDADSVIATFEDGETWGYVPLARLLRPWECEKTIHCHDEENGSGGGDVTQEEEERWRG